MLGEAYLETGKPKQTLPELDRALAFGKDGPGELQLPLARAFYALGRRKEARKSAEQAVAKDPSLRRADALFGSAARRPAPAAAPSSPAGR